MLEQHCTESHASLRGAQDCCISRLLSHKQTRESWHCVPALCSTVHRRCHPLEMAGGEEAYPATEHAPERGSQRTERPSSQLVRATVPAQASSAACATDNRAASCHAGAITCSLHIMLMSESMTSSHRGSQLQAAQSIDTQLRACYTVSLKCVLVFCDHIFSL